MERAERLIPSYWFGFLESPMCEESLAPPTVEFGMNGDVIEQQLGLRNRAWEMIARREQVDDTS